MEFPRWKKSLRVALGALERVVDVSKNILLSAGLITLATNQAAGQSATPAHELTLSNNDLRKYSSKFLLKPAVKSALSTTWVQHRSHSSHSSHRSHSSHSSHASHYSSSTPSHSSAPVYTPPRSTTPSRPSRTRSTSHSDDFSGGSRSSVKWRLGSVSSGSSHDEGVSVTRRNGRLEIGLRPDVPGKHYNGYLSESPFDLTGREVGVEVVQTAPESANTIFALVIDKDNWYRFVKEGDSLFFQSNMAGMQASANTNYNWFEYRYWRFRHDSDSSILYWETSPDGERWSVRHASSTKIPVSSLYVELSAGTYQPIKGPGTVVFDNFRIVTLN